MTAALALYLMLFPQPPHARPKPIASTQDRRYPQFPAMADCVERKEWIIARLEDLEKERSMGCGYIRGERILMERAELTRFFTLLEWVIHLQWDRSGEEKFETAEREAVLLMGADGFRLGFSFGRE